MLNRWLENLFDHEAKLPPGFVMPTNLLGFVWHFVRQIKKVLAIVLVLELSTSLATLALPMLISALVAAFTSPNPVAALSTPQFYWVLAFAIVVKPALVVAYRWVFFTAYHPYAANLGRLQLHQYMLGQSIAFFQSRKSGEIGGMVASAGDSLRMAIQGSIGYTLNSTFTILISTVAVFTVHWTLGLLVLVWLGVFSCLGWYYIPRQKQAAAKMTAIGARNTGMFVDVYANMETVKLNSREADELERARQAIGEHNAANRLYEGVTQRNMMCWTEVASTPFMLGATVLLCLWLFKQGTISGAQIALTIPLIQQILQIASWSMYQNSLVVENFSKLGEMLKTFSTPYSVVDELGAYPLEVTDGDIEFQRVTVRYDGGTTALDEISLTIQPGKCIGIVGPSGSGKSTLVRALARCFDISAGRIRIDGEDISDVMQTSLRTQMTFVSQDPSLLHRSVRENIAYGRPDATDEEIRNSAMAANAHDFIMGLRDAQGNTGYDVIVGERGLKLSSGQRQRIAIARALLANKRIVVLDEATSSLDGESEQAIQENMERLLKGRTVIAIAHRLSTLDMMDYIAVVENGRITAFGTHIELMAYDNFYSRNRLRENNGFLPAAAA